MNFYKCIYYFNLLIVFYGDRILTVVLLYHFVRFMQCLFKINIFPDHYIYIYLKIMSNNPENDKKTNNAVSGTVMLATATISCLATFGLMYSRTKRKSEKELQELVKISMEEIGNGKMESPASLAIRALRKGTIYAFGGVSIICLSIWGLSGAKNMEEFKQKMQKIMPVVPKAKTKSDIHTWDDLIAEVKIKK